MQRRRYGLDYFPDLGFGVSTGWCGLYMSHYQCDHICKQKTPPFPAVFGF
jgi:hypothetical protein